jgi:hypothetical protein
MGASDMLEFLHLSFCTGARGLSFCTCQVFALAQRKAALFAAPSSQPRADPVTLVTTMSNPILSDLGASNCHNLSQVCHICNNAIDSRLRPLAIGFAYGTIRSDRVRLSIFGAYAQLYHTFVSRARNIEKICYFYLLTVPLA